MAFGWAFGLAALAFIAWMAVQLGGLTLTIAVDDIGEAAAAGIAAVACVWASLRTLGRLRAR